MNILFQLGDNRVGIFIMKKKQATIQKVKELCARLNGFTDEKLTEIETVIKNYLVDHPKDTEMWLRLTMLEHNPPWEDPDRMVGYLHSILAYDPFNIQAVLMLAYIEDLFFGRMKDETRDVLYQLQAKDPEILSMIEYAKAFDYLEENRELFVKHLAESIRLWDKHVNNFKLLGKYYIKIGNVKKGILLLKKALENIQVIYGENYDTTDITDINEFFNYYYKGTHTTFLVRDDLEELLIRVEH